MKNCRYLTKSRFKLALECPTKLYYTGKKEYANKRLEDTFLLALAEGGFQVGELAKLYFPGGHDIKTLGYDEALQQTNDLLLQENVIIYEAAVKADKLFIRVDILVKNGDLLECIEVKAKSLDPSEDDQFCNSNGTIKAAWKPYLYDVAFQKHVIKKAFPSYRVDSYLMLADKKSICPTDGLNQKFRVIKDQNGRKSVVLSPGISDIDLSVKLLRRINVDSVCEELVEESLGPEKKCGFAEWIDNLADHYDRDIKIQTAISTECNRCEFIATQNEMAEGWKSGFHECWKEGLGWHLSDFEVGTVLDIWNYRKKGKLIEDSCIKLSDVNEDDISPKNDGKPGLSSSERQWMQVRKIKENDNSLWIDKDSLGHEMSKWRYPLHCIDFETTMVAIPFNKGRHPYEGVAFQFSHHTIDNKGAIAHANEYLNVNPGEFPNYDFIRNLMAALNQDDGSIFRYSPHENTFLNIIYRQLTKDTGDIPDKDDLLQFIESITTSTRDSVEKWEGKRNMLDLWAMVKRYYYDPSTKGSNSIKKILPSVLNRSSRLKEKYSQPIYGSTTGIHSFNYSDWTWVKFEGDTVVDPYALLPKMFQDVSEQELSLLSDSDELREGGAAMTAYARMQFEEISDYERNEIRKALLKYCELDTMAMVMIIEGWQDLIL